MSQGLVTQQEDLMVILMQAGEISFCKNMTLMETSYSKSLTIDLKGSRK